MLSVIITDIAGQLLVFGIYCVRAYMDTRSEEMIKLERDKLNLLPEEIRERVEDIFDKDDGCNSDDELDDSNVKEVDVEE